MEPQILVRKLGRSLGISMDTCKSSNILAFGYDAKEKALWVVFHNQDIYKYLNISEEQYDDLRLADSKGKWVNTNLVKTKTDFERYEMS